MMAVAAIELDAAERVARMMSPAKVDAIDETTLRSEARRLCGLDYERIVLIRSPDEKPGKRERELIRQVRASGADVLEVSVADLEERPSEVGRLVRMFAG